MSNHPSQFILKGNFVSRYLAECCREFVPSKTKRMVAVTAALGFLRKSNTLDDGVLTSVNRELRLAKEVDEMKLGVWINGWLLKGAEIADTRVYTEERGLLLEEASECDIWQISLQIVRALPIWLYYGSLQLMIADIHDAVKNMQSFFSVKSKQLIIH